MKSQVQQILSQTRGEIISYLGNYEIYLGNAFDLELSDLDNLSIGELINIQNHIDSIPLP